MLKWGYIILIAGAVLLVSGIVLSILWAISFAGEFIRENTIIGQTLLRPSKSINATLQVRDIVSPISLALHFKPELSNVTLSETVRDPNDKVVNTNEFSRDFLTTFKPNTIGKFTLTISNPSSTPVNVDGVFGHMPFVGDNNQVNLNALHPIIAGILLIILGIVTLIMGIIFVILDRRKERRPSLTR
jgi:hypothetical protein